MEDVDALPELSPLTAHRRLLREAPRALGWRGEAVGPWQRKVRRRLRQLLAVPTRTHAPLRVRRLWTRDTPLGRIEKIQFTAEPGAVVPAYWCTPRDVSPPYTTFICLQGHNTGMHNSIGVSRDDETTPIEVAGDRDFALGCLRRGIAALCIEQRSHGERRERVQQKINPHNGCHDAAQRALLLGRTLLGERVFDVDRALDYLATRPDVDMRRVGVMGNSGGGTVATYAAALLPRIACAMPSCAFGSYAVTSATIYHCACHYVPGILRWMDMGDVLGAFAPRPVTIVAGKTDDISPVLPSTRQQFAHLRRIYAAAGAPDACRLVIGPEGHRFYADAAWPVMLELLGDGIRR